MRLAPAGNPAARPTHQYTTVQMRRSFDGPGLGNEKLLEKPDGIPIGHACHEIARSGVDTLLFDRAVIQELAGPLADFFPEAREDVGRLLELDGREAVLVHRVEE